MSERHEVGNADRAAGIREAIEIRDRLRRYLSAKVLGQDRAVETVCEACFTAVLRRAAHASPGKERAGPRLILTFAGPPGCGKTLLAECLAQGLQEIQPAEAVRRPPGQPPAGPPFWDSARPAEDKPIALRCLHMSEFSDARAHEKLLGFDETYNRATSGILTDFIRSNPRTLLVVEEIEKAHITTQNLFLQILDRGTLSDDRNRDTVDYSSTIIVFTTNLGRELYDAPNRAGVLWESRGFSETVLEALLRESREDRGNDRDGLSPELVSRLAKGYTVLFERLPGQALERIARLALGEYSRELMAGTGLSLSVRDAVVFTLLVLRFGLNGDARRLTTGVRRFLDQTVQDLLSDHRDRLLETDSPLLNDTRELRLGISSGEENAVLRTMARIEKDKTRVLIVDDEAWRLDLGDSFELLRAEDDEEADRGLKEGRTHFVLLDLHIASDRGKGEMTRGLQILRRLRTRFPDLPVYLFSESPDERGVSAEMLERVSQEGGARGVLRKPFFADQSPNEEQRAEFLGEIEKIRLSLRRERLLRHFQGRGRVVAFRVRARIDTTPRSQQGLPLDLEICQIRDFPLVSALDRNRRGWADLPRERFEDIAGAEEAKTRLREVAGWLADPRPIRAMGLDPPRGILITGPPGTGKTTLARAVAGQAEVPFFAISATEVLSKWVGESEKNLRDLFECARRYAPAVIFIDEIDSIGARRGRGDTQRASEVSLLNELLAQMDGFRQGEQPVFVLAATNRPDILDPALVRPGRFDARIHVGLPGASARARIFELNLAGMPREEGVDIPELSDRSAGLSGADIRQVCREAGMLALRAGANQVSQGLLLEALTTVRLGVPTERRGLDKAALMVVAAHEAGHALAHWLLFPERRLAQISILPRGRLLGFSEGLGEDTPGVPTRQWAGKTVQVFLAGRVAEEMLHGSEQVTSGCADDLDRASSLAVRVVCEWGMDEDFGLFCLPGSGHGHDPAPGRLAPAELQSRGLERARLWLSERAAEVRALLAENRQALENLAVSLAEKERLDRKEIEHILAPHRPPGSAKRGSSKTRKTNQKDTGVGK